MKISDLKKRKEELGYTNEKVSALSGVPLGTVQKIFGGATTRPRYNTLQSIECVLFPELHSHKEAALYKDIVHNLTLDYADMVSEPVSFEEYSAEMPVEDHKNSYEKVISWKEPGEYTVEDWKGLPDGSMMELIDGVFYDRNTPTLRHQFIVTWLTVQLCTAVKEAGKEHCLVLMAPTGVKIEANDEKNCLIPDILAVCDEEKYNRDEGLIVGAPDFVVEVLSPSTERQDKTIKLGKYWKAGVAEDWVINIKDKEVWAYSLCDNAIINRYSFEDQIPLGIYDGKIVIDFKSINDQMKSFFGE